MHWEAPEMAGLSLSPEELLFRDGRRPGEAPKALLPPQTRQSARSVRSWGEADMAQLDSFLQMAVRARASDLHIATGEPPLFRQFGRLRKLKGEPLTPEATKSLVYGILSDGQRKVVEQELQLDFSYELRDVGRFRGNVILDKKGLSATFRIIPTRIPSLEELGLPDVVRRFCAFHQGLILVTGAAGQGKSTTLAAMIDLINSTRPVHILTIEDPVEFVHPIKKGIVNQRQLGLHTRSFANALRSALREDPDVIMVGELRDRESVSLATTAAETGHLVMGTLSTSSSPKTVARLVDSFPSEEQNQIRMMVADSLRAVITQMLLPNADLSGLVLATEIMIGTIPVSNLIRSEKLHQIPSVIQTNRSLGMCAMDESVQQLFKAGKITWETARSYAGQTELSG
jgi:twitching motility protein PilT